MIVTKQTTKQIVEVFITLILMMLLLNALYDVFKVFFGILTFALIFTVSFSGAYHFLCNKLHHKRKLAAILYSIVLTAIIVVPLLIFFSTLFHRIRDLIFWIGEMRKNGFPPLPKWISDIPFVGDSINSLWAQVQRDPKGLFQLHESKIKSILEVTVLKSLGMLGVALELIVGVIISAMFLYKGPLILKPVKNSLQHLLGENTGASLLSSSAMAIRGVSIGVMGTAFIAAIFAWIGLTIGGIPIAVGLSALIFFLVVIQVGPLPVWIPLIIYAISKESTGITIFFIAWGIALLVIDAVIKPLLIGKSGGTIPFLALFIGVVGGVAVWGFTGMFKGAIIMAVGYTIFIAWLREKGVQSREELLNEANKE